MVVLSIFSVLVYICMYILYLEKSGNSVQEINELLSLSLHTCACRYILGNFWTFVYFYFHLKFTFLIYSSSPNVLVIFYHGTYICKSNV
jgi:hypothetical protein